MSAPHDESSAAAASGSVPSSIRPEGSSVIWAIIGTLRPASCMALRAPKICDRSSSRSCAVSAMTQSTPPCKSPSVCSRKISTSWEGRMRPRSGSPRRGESRSGPGSLRRSAGGRRRVRRGRLPRGRCGRRSGSPPAFACPGRTRRAWAGWRRRCWSPPPRSPPRGSERWTPATTSGRVSERISLQPCRPSKSRTVSSPASCIRCSVVPMAPSKTTTPRAVASRRFLSAIRSRAP